ncbi:hypothetical protein TIFTF001_009867 [Ficus carica]|uniref:Uncharacterized protein n=1 Tax=Ficus carica TaxID=3494 RepID=A0AA87ZX56_FICCA|nr:hypothetical protein TIFTF001_009867 [Ficus carica]
MNLVALPPRFAAAVVRIGCTASDHGSGADFYPLIIAVIGILTSSFILLSY